MNGGLLLEVVVRTLAPAWYSREKTVQSCGRCSDTWPSVITISVTISANT